LPGADGSGVHVYVVDTGIRTTHNEFSGMTFGNGYDFIDNDSDYSDCHGHGTHVSGTAVGQNHGIARGATLHGVRVLNCQGSGTGTQVINGINWVANNAVLPAVANMSLGGGYSASENQAVNNAVAAGVVFVVAAGNENTDACSKSPASAADALTVAASTSSDVRSSFSNYGSCVDVFAPGSSITSATNDSDTSTATWNGTSMASPHVAGVAALYLGQNPSWTPAQVANALLGNASSGRISDLQGSPNELLYWGTEPDNAPPPTPTPEPGDCTGYNNSLSGSLSGTGDEEIWTYSSRTSGWHTGELTGPGSADFDLYLQRKSGSSWVNVASSLSVSSNEFIDYYASSSKNYRWRVYSYSGSGNYTLCVNP
jgi:subtilisin family serine protease